MNTRRDGAGWFGMRLALLLWLFTSSALAQYVPAPAEVAYESELRTRLGWLGQQEYELRHNDEARRCRRWKIMGITFGSISVAGFYPALFLLAATSANDDDQWKPDRKVMVSVLSALGAGALTGFGFAIASRVTNPNRLPLHDVRVEQKHIRRELRRRADVRAMQLSLDGLTLRF